MDHKSSRFHRRWTACWASSRGKFLKAFLFSIGLIAFGVPQVIAGSLDVLPGARYWDDFGMRVTFDNTNPCYVQDDLPAAESRYRCRFYFRLHHLDLSEGNGFILFAAYNQSEELQFSVEINRVSGETKLHCTVRQDDGSYLETATATDPTIGEGWHAIELDWQSNAGAGLLDLWLNGAEIAGVENVNNGSGQVDSVRWGAVAGNDAASSGFFDVDYFESRRNTQIGLKCHDTVAVGAALEGWFSEYVMTDLVQIISAQCP